MTEKSCANWRVVYGRNNSQDFTNLGKAKRFLREYTEGSIFEYHENALSKSRLILRYFLSHGRLYTA